MNLKKKLYHSSIVFTCILFMFAFGFSVKLNSQNNKVNVFNWQAYSSMVNAKTLAYYEDGSIWVGTTGGVYRYDLNTGETKEFRNISHLLSSDINYLAIDKSSKTLYMASTDGVIEILENIDKINLDDVQLENGVNYSKKWIHIIDIKNSKINNPIINDMLILDDYIYMVGGFGMTKFLKGAKVFTEEARRYGVFQPNADTKRIVSYKDRIWVATLEGVASISAENTISDRNNWDNYSLNNENVIDLITKSDTLFALTNNAIYYLNYTDSSKFELYEDTRKVIKFVENVISDELIYIDSTSLKMPRAIFNYQLNYLSNRVNNIYTLKHNSENYIFVLYSNFGLQSNLLTDVSITSKILTPNSPAINSYEDINIYTDPITNENEVWIGSGVDNGLGAMVLRNNKWTNFNNITTPQIYNNSIHKVNLDKKGNVFFSTFGGGLFYLERKNEINEIDFTKSFDITNFNASNSPIVGNTDETFPIIGDVKIDKDNNAWFTNFGASSIAGPLLIKFDNNKQFTSYENCISPNRRFHYNLMIDENNTKWVASSFPKINNLGGTANTGMMYYNDTRKVNNQDVCGNINISNFPNIKSNTQNAIAQDKTGIIWIGTVNGLVALFNPSAIFSNNPNFAIREVIPLNNIEVYDIFVDAVNNKWVGTSQGLYVLNPDGTEVLSLINKDNSPIISNIVYSITGDEKTGKMYIGTNAELYSVDTYSKTPQEEYSIKCSPQPFNPNKDTEIIIDGLAENSEIKIITLSGELIKTITTLSKVITWDGRNEARERVQSGVYLVVASSLNGDKSGVGKLAIVWK